MLRCLAFFFKDVQYQNYAKWSCNADLHIEWWDELIKDYITECCQDYRVDVDDWVTHKADANSTYFKDSKVAFFFLFKWAQTSFVSFSKTYDHKRIRWIKLPCIRWTKLNREHVRKINKIIKASYLMCKMYSEMVSSLLRCLMANRFYGLIIVLDDCLLGPWLPAVTQH